MCTQVNFIKPRHLRFLPHVKPIPVNCGQCEECRQSKAKDLYVRARMEYDSALKNGGIGFMCCLTYSDPLLPKFIMNGSEVLVFNKKHVIDFLKRLRTNLDRKFQSMFGVSAPDFKYLVTSEYGTNPSCSHRPHYHLLFFFYHYISPFLFNLAFKESLYNRRCKNLLAPTEQYFGVISQCDVIDSKRGGIHYSAKYVCKDIMYEPQRKYITELINFTKAQIDSEFNVIAPNSQADLFRNRCIRSTKEYKQAVRDRVLPLRHMLQFEMHSSDFGANVVISKYGKQIIEQPIINFDGFPYSLPHIVKDRIERFYGFDAVQRTRKRQFDKAFSRKMQELCQFNVISPSESMDLQIFAQSYLYPNRGTLSLFCPYDLDPLQTFSPYVPNDVLYIRPWADVLSEFVFFEDNDFLTIKYRIDHLLKLCTSGEINNFHRNLAIRKNEQQKQLYEQKKRNRAC